MHFIQHCLSDSYVSEEPGIEPRTVAEIALTVGRRGVFYLFLPALAAFRGGGVVSTLWDRHSNVLFPKQIAQ